MNEQHPKAPDRPAVPPRGNDWDDEDDAYGDPSKVKDEGVLDSLGEAVSDSVRDAAEDPRLPREPMRKPR